MSELEYDITIKQVATNEHSAAARLDRATEAALYRLYRDFFRIAEEERRWSVWNDIPWDEALQDPPATLVDSVLYSYREDLFLPDYSSHALRILRASRGRAWFLTRWSYEEGKHMLSLNEWLIRTKVLTDVQARELTEAHLQAFRWIPPYDDGIPLIADMLLWELREIERYSALHADALAAGDRPLAVATERILSDETAHRDFLRSALGIIAAGGHADKVQQAIADVAKAQELPDGAAALTALLAVPAA